MKVFVSGGSGYIGSVLVPRLLHLGHEVTVYDNLMYRQTSLLSSMNNSRLRFVYGDVRDQTKLAECIKGQDVIIPLAAIVGAPACEEDRLLATMVNVEHVRFITENTDCPIILPQTNSGYGIGEKDAYCTEETPLRPITHYGRTKCMAEELVLKKGGISLRLATVMGCSPRMRLDLLVNHFVYRAMSDGYIVLFEKDFKRNYIHVQDVCNVFVLMMDNYEQCKGNAFNVGLSSANLSKWELANKIKEFIPRFSIQCDEINQDPDKRDYIVSNEKIESHLGWEPLYSLEDGIRELIKAYPILFASQQTFTNL